MHGRFLSGIMSERCVLIMEGKGTMNMMQWRRGILKICWKSRFSLFSRLNNFLGDISIGFGELWMCWMR